MIPENMPVISGPYRGISREGMAEKIAEAAVPEKLTEGLAKVDAILAQAEEEEDTVVLEPVKLGLAALREQIKKMEAGGRAGAEKIAEVGPVGLKEGEVYLDELAAKTRGYFDGMLTQAKHDRGRAGLRFVEATGRWAVRGDWAEEIEERAKFADRVGGA